MASEPQPAPLALFEVRRRTREVAIGEVTIGGTRPIAVQSMTTTRTSDAAATAQQVIELARAGCAIVRVTVPSGPDADALPEIRRRLKQERVTVPLVADIHFTPKLALQVVEHVDKVRINPGNFADRKAIGGGEYDEQRWQQDIERMHGLFAPVVDRCRELGVALRIGTNHGSLSDRIVHRYGDSPEGMVQSALEFIAISEDRGFRDIVVSMKASNTQVMVSAYRLLAVRLAERGEAYPLHLGVTEAGGGDEGRMKSAVGIATLLAEGLGDTVRVSLTEDPVHELPVARELVDRFGLTRWDSAGVQTTEIVETRNRLDPFRRPARSVSVGPLTWGGEEVPRVEIALPLAEAARLPALLMAKPAIELVDIEVTTGSDLTAAVAALARAPRGRVARSVTFLGAPAALLADGAAVAALKAGADRVTLLVDPLQDELVALCAALDPLPVLALLTLDRNWGIDAARKVVHFARSLAGAGPKLLAGLRFHADDSAPITAQRLLAAALDRAGAPLPLVLSDRGAIEEDLRVGMAGRLGALLIDGLGDAVRLPITADPRRQVHLAHGILQAARRRLERAEYIACPSCGRTLFDLETTTERIRAITSHLKLKIAVMGCVVNGPGEMADADFGFVGWGEGKVALFVGKQLVERDIPYAEAPTRLVDLIKSHGRWAEPSTLSETEQPVN